MNSPLISICIPSYERLDYFKRLLDSIKIQKFRDFEVIVTDDSKTENVQLFIERYDADFPLYYFKNEIALGTVRNMFEGRKYAKSNWIKIIHDDDWFYNEFSVGELANEINSGVDIIFCGHNDVYEINRQVVERTLSIQQFLAISAKPYVLIADNKIGNPSVLMFNHAVKEEFETFMKWFVDVEYYIRMFYSKKITYIDKPLVNIGCNESQITNQISRNPSIVIPEALYMIAVYHQQIGKNIIVYDGWWRLFRNLGIRSEADIRLYEKKMPIPEFIKSMLKHQRMIPRKLLLKGYVSKPAMILSYILNIGNLK